MWSSITVQLSLDVGMWWENNNINEYVDGQGKILTADTNSILKSVHVTL